MPIANCIVTSECKEGAGDLIELWAQESGQSPDYMTVNIVTSNQQLGNTYSVMATLQLPSMWSDSNVSLLQIGLAKAVSAYFNLPPNEVFVVTQIVESGRVVEAGQEERW